MKKVLASLLVLSLLITLVPLGALAVSAENTSGNYKYTVSEGKATITGYIGSGVDVVIPSKLGGYPVSVIGYEAFYGNSKLVSVTIANSVTIIDTAAFNNCANLTSVTIPNSVSIIGHSAFRECIGLTEIDIPDSVTTIGVSAFYYCNKLRRVTIGDGVVYIGAWAFSGCVNLNLVTIGNNVSTIDDMAFYSCSELNSIIIPSGVVTIGDGAFNNCTGLVSITLPSSITTIGDSAFLIYPYDELEDVYYEGTESQWRKISFGTSNECLLDATLHYNSFGPQAPTLKTIYSEKVYHAGGGFFSETSSLTDCVEFFLQFNNILNKDITPIKLTASINGSGLSFDRTSNKKTQTTIIDTLETGEATNELLMLFPVGLNLSLSGNTYVVTVKLESESFGKVTTKYTFTLEDLETKAANEHLAYIATNKDYSLSKQNFFGNELVSVKDKADYKWSKITSLNFDNYYDIVVADILAKILEAKQTSSSLVPEILKDWTNNYKKILEGIVTIVTDDYAEVVTVSETEIDKLIKLCKYDADTVYANDKVYQTVLKTFQKVGNVEKLKKVYQAVDVTGKAFGFVSLGVNILEDAIEWGNKLTLFNAFDNAEKELKSVMKTLAGNIPSSEKKMREAINDYVNYSDSDSGKVLEILESFTGMLSDVSLEAFDSFVGKNMVEYVFGVQVLNWIGMIPVAGGTFSSTAAFSGVQTAFGSFLTGVTLGVCFSDLLCDTGDKSVEMCKIVAVSEYSPYIIETLEDYEDKFIKNRSNAAVAEYEYAFALHKAAQTYIADHTIKELEIERDSIIIKLFGKADYNETIAMVQDYKNKTESICCHGNGNMVLSAPIILQQPENVQVQNGATAKVSVEALGDGVTYQWYLKNAGATKYSKSSITTNAYSTKMSTSSRDRYVYCIVKDKNGKMVKSNTVVLRMATSITSQPETKMVSAPFGETVKIPITALGDGLTYTWYFKNDKDSPFFGFSKSSVKSSTYSTTMNDKSNGRQVYCVIKDKYRNTVATNTFILRPCAVITTQPKTDYAKMGKEVSVSVRASGEGLNYQWYIKNDGQSKYSKSSITSRTYSTTMTTKSKNRRVLCIVYDKYGNSVQSSSVVLRESVSIVTQPKTVTVAKNKTAKVTVKASGDGLKYTWYIKNDGASKYSKSSVTSATYSTKMTAKSKNRLVYCVVTDKYGNTVKTVTVKLKMK